VGWFLSILLGKKLKTKDSTEPLLSPKSPENMSGTHHLVVKFRFHKYRYYFFLGNIH